MNRLVVKIGVVIVPLFAGVLLSDSTVIAQVSSNSGVRAGQGSGQAPKSPRTSHRLRRRRLVARRPSERRRLRYGMQGADVARWQTFLIGQGFYPGRPDGKFGSRTLEQTIAFQRFHNLVGDGVVGSQTRRFAATIGFYG